MKVSYMEEELKNIWEFVINTITNVDWSEIIKAFVAAATPLIAFLALRNWKRQDKAKREAEFLDALIETVHTYIAKMSGPIALLEIAKIGMESHIAVDGKDDKEVKGAIEYIKKNGAQTSKRLQEALQVVQPTTIHLRSLVAKGQVFEFRDYKKCQNAVAMLTWQFDRIEGFAAIVGSTSLNWSNQTVLETLKKVLEIQANDIRNHLQESNISILEFIKQTYNRLYK